MRRWSNDCGRQGAILLGALNMDEFAYGFSTEKPHHGTTRNPRAPDHIAGGSSGGSAAAIVAGFASLTLGSDTNGSIRVPASLCGCFGLKPTFGRLTRRGAFPFVHSLDHVGPLAADTRDLALAYDILQGPDALDPACRQRAAAPVSDIIDHGAQELRIARLGGWFERFLSPQMTQAMEGATRALGIQETVELGSAELARSAAYCLTAAEGAALHFDRLAHQALAFDPATVGRLMAGITVPAYLLDRVQRIRAHVQAEARNCFRDGTCCWRRPRPARRRDATRP